MRPHLLPLLLGLVALALLLGAATAHAQPASAPAATATAPAAPAAAAGAPAAPEPGFKPLAPGEAAGPPDSFSAPDLVKVAYSLIWVAVVGFLVSLWRRHRRLGAEVAALQKRLERGGRE